MILTVAEPIWNQFISDIILLRIVYTLRRESLQFDESHAVKYYESIASNIHLWYYYTDIINLVDWNGKKHLIVTNVCHCMNIKQLFCSLGMFCYKFNFGLLPVVFDNFFAKVSNVHRHHTRSQCDFHVRALRTICVDKFMKYRGTLLWNQFRDNVKNSPNFNIFKKLVKSPYLLSVS